MQIKCKSNIMLRPVQMTTILCISIALRTTAQRITNPVVEKIAEGFQFVEGPVWKAGVGLYFSDIPANIVYLWNEWDGTVPSLQPSGNSNGLAFDEEGNLLLAQHGPRQVSRLEGAGTIIPLASHYDGKRLNSPNDLALHSDGSVFFTDPPYGLMDQGGTSELGYNGIFRLSPSGEVQLLDSTLDRPNGIAFSPDETKLYVTDSETRRIYVWDVVDDTVISNKQQLAFMQPSGYADGMKVDPEGYLYVTGPIGIWIFHPDGTVIDTIPVPGQTSNCAWGDDGFQALYVTSGNAVHKIYNGTVNSVRNTGQKTDWADLRCYPNPFSGSIYLSLNLNQSGRIRCEVIDLKGAKITTLFKGFLTYGSHRLEWNAGNCRSGRYLVQTQFENSPPCILSVVTY